MVTCKCNVGDTRKDIARQAAFGFLLSQERQSGNGFEVERREG